MLSVFVDFRRRLRYRSPSELAPNSPKLDGSGTAATENSAFANARKALKFVPGYAKVPELYFVLLVNEAMPLPRVTLPSINAAFFAAILLTIVAAAHIPRTAPARQPRSRLLDC